MTEPTPAVIEMARAYLLKRGYYLSRTIDYALFNEAAELAAAFAEQARREERERCDREIFWLRRLLSWARPRLRHEGYEDALDRYLAMGPQEQPADEPPVIRSSQG